MGDQISVGDIINAEAIAIGREAIAVKTTGDVTIYQGPAYPRLDYRTEISDLVSYYTQTFVGRTAEVQQLTHFAAQESSGYLLVEALPGYGKSALMFHLLHRHESGSWGSSPKPYLLYFFIRQQGKRNTPVAFLQALNSQLLEILNQPGGVPTDLDALRSQFSQLWVRALDLASSEQPLLLLVDGLDEMSVGDVTIANLLPSSLTSYSHVIVSSRPNPQPLEQVSLEHPFRKASVIRLQIFSESDIRALLEEFNASAEVAANLSPRVLTMTKGEPLFVRFVCQEVVAKGESALLRLEQNPPADVEAYFRQQFKQLDTLTEDDQGEIAWEILGLLVVTLGGITIEEMAEVLDERQRRVRKAVDLIKRFLLGDPRFILMHLQLRKVLTEEFSSREQANYRQQLLNWCRSYQEQNWPKETPGYVLAYYAEHLSAAGHKEALYALINKCWMDVQFERTYSYRAFAEDVALAIEVARSEEPPNLLQEVRGCLIYATLGSLATNVPPEILGGLAQVGEVEKAQGFAALIQDPEKQSQAYRLIGEALLKQGAKEEARSMLNLALSKAEAIAASSVNGSLWDRAREMRNVARVLSQIGDREGLNQALTVASTIPDGQAKADALGTIAQAMARSGDREGLNQALTTAVEIEFAGYRADALSSIAQAFAQVEDKQGLDRAATIAASLESEYEHSRNEYRAQALAGVAPALAQVSDIERLHQVLTAPELLEYERHRVKALGDVAVTLIRLGNSEELSQILKTLETVGTGWNEEEHKAQALVKVAQALAQKKNKDELNHLLEIAKMMQSDWYKAQAQSGIAQAVAQLEGREGSTWAVEIAEAIAEQDLRVEALGNIAQSLAQVRDQERLNRVLTAAIASKDSKPEALANIAQALAQIEDWDGLDEVVSTVISIESEYSKAPILRQVAEVLGQVGDKARLNQVLEASEAISNEEYKVEILSGVAQALIQLGEREQATALVEQSLELATFIYPGFGGMAKVLALVTSLLVQLNDQDRIRRALTTAATVEYENDRTRTLNAVIDVLIQAKDRESLNQSIIIATTISYEIYKVDTLIEIARSLFYAGEIDKAAAVAEVSQQLVERLNERRDRETALISVIPVLAAVEHLDGLEQALVMAIAIEPHFLTRGDAFNALLRAFALVKDRVHLEQVMSMAEAQDGEYKVKALSVATQSLDQIGEKGRAVNLAAQALAATLGIDHPTTRVNALRDAVQALALVGSKEGLTQALMATVAIPRGVGDIREQVLIEVVQKLALVKHREGLNQALKLATEMFQDTYIEDIKWSVWSNIALAFIQAEEKDQALSLAKQALVAANNSNFLVSIKAEVLSKIAQTFLLAEDREQLNQVLIAIAEIGVDAWGGYYGSPENFSEDSKEKALLEIIQAMFQVGDREGLNQVLTIAKGMEHDKNKVKVLLKLAESFAVLEEKDEENQALSTATVIRDRNNNIEVLADVTQALLRVGDPRQAIALWMNEFEKAKTIGRRAVFNVLQVCSSTIAEFDKGQTLWSLYELLQEVDDWWTWH